jgi:hypothetical protein
LKACCKPAKPPKAVAQNLGDSLKLSTIHKIKESHDAIIASTHQTASSIEVIILSSKPSPKKIKNWLPCKAVPAKKKRYVKSTANNDNSEDACEEGDEDLDENDDEEVSEGQNNSDAEDPLNDTRNGFFNVDSDGSEGEKTVMGKCKGKKMEKLRAAKWQKGMGQQVDAQAVGTSPLFDK